MKARQQLGLILALGACFVSGSNLRAGQEYYAGWAVGGTRDGYGTILRSTDSGENWIRQGTGQIANVDMGGVCALDPDIAWVVGYSDGYAAIYHTTDGGKTWERKGSPADVPDTDLFKVSAPDGAHVWAVGVGTILYSEDSGDSWNNQVPAGYGSVHLQGVSAPDNGTVWVGGGPESGYPVILKSVDGGSTWTRQSGGDVATTGFNHILGISAVDGQTAWAIGGKTDSGSWFILKTTDGGNSWSIQTRGPHDGNGICAVDESTVWGASDSTISWSFDGGATWGEQLSYEYTMGVSAVNDREAWAVSYYGWEGSIWHTTDGGTTWTVLTELDGRGIPGLWTVSFSNQTVPPPRTCPWGTDYDGDGTSDPAVFRPGSGLWAVRDVTRVYFGMSGDDPVPGDYSGDGTCDIAVFRSGSGFWAVRGVTRLYFGRTGDIPVSGLYANPSAASSIQIGIYRPSSGFWAVRGLTRAYFGAAGDLPVPGYYGPEGLMLMGIYRPSTGLWAVRDLTRLYFGAAGDEPIPGDYSGDGTWEAGVYRASSGLWAARGVTRVYFGTLKDSPVPADLNGDSTDEIGVFRGVSGLWAVRDLTRVYFGLSGDVPVTR